MSLICLSRLIRICLMYSPKNSPIPLVSVQVIDRAMPREARVADSQRGLEARTVRARHAALPHTRLSDSRGQSSAAA
jgi:hypothetical protein